MTWLLRNALAGAWLLILTVGVGRAQDHAVVLIDTNLPKAMLYADSTLLGPASRGTFLVPVHTQRLRLLPPGGTAWSITPIATPFEARGGDTMDVHLPFPHHYQIESVPFGASVTLEDVAGRTLLGKTPVLYKAEEVLEGMLHIERQGYLPETVQPGQEVWNRYVLTLQPIRMDDVESAEKSWRPPPKRRRWIDYSAAVLAIAAGATSIHYKFKADRLNDRYLKNGDPELRPRIKSLDTRAAVSLGAMQVGLGVLAVRFIFK